MTIFQKVSGFARLAAGLGRIHILFLVGTRDRLTVMVEWFWAYLTFGRGTRLITGDADIVKAKVRPLATALLMPERR